MSLINPDKLEKRWNTFLLLLPLFVQAFHLLKTPPPK